VNDDHDLRSRGVDIGHDLVDQGEYDALSQLRVRGRSPPRRARGARFQRASAVRLPPPDRAAQAGDGYLVNHKKLFRLYREEKLAVRRRGSRKRTIGTRTPMCKTC
jgi:hypothetical protein